MRRLTFLAVVMLACLLPPLAKANTCTGLALGGSTEACLNFIEPVGETLPVTIDAKNWFSILLSSGGVESGTFIGVGSSLAVGSAFNFNWNIYEDATFTQLSDTLTLALNVVSPGLFSATSHFSSDVAGVISPVGTVGDPNTHSIVETGGLQYVDLTYNTGSGTLDFNSVMDLGFQSDAVPDGGVTAMLLGVALVGLETLRRKVHA